MVDEIGIKNVWKQYMEKIMNEENEWDHDVLYPVKGRKGRLITLQL